MTYEQTLWAVRALSETATFKESASSRRRLREDSQTAGAELPLTLRVREEARLDAERAKRRVGIGEKVVPATVTLPWRRPPVRGFVLQRDNWGFWERATAKASVGAARS